VIKNTNSYLVKFNQKLTKECGNLWLVGEKKKKFAYLFSNFLTAFFLFFFFSHLVGLYYWAIIGNIMKLTPLVDFISPNNHPTSLLMLLESPLRTNPKQYSMDLNRDIDGLLISLQRGINRTNKIYTIIRLRN
jgi:hypothetical protein